MSTYFESSRTLLPNRTPSPVIPGAWPEFDAVVNDPNKLSNLCDVFALPQTSITQRAHVSSEGLPTSPNKQGCMESRVTRPRISSVQNAPPNIAYTNMLLSDPLPASHYSSGTFDRQSGSEVSHNSGPFGGREECTSGTQGDSYPQENEIEQLFLSSELPMSDNTLSPILFWSQESTPASSWNPPWNQSCNKERRSPCLQCESQPHSWVNYQNLSQESVSLCDRSPNMSTSYTDIHRPTDNVLSLDIDAVEPVNYVDIPHILTQPSGNDTWTLALSVMPVSPSVSLINISPISTTSSRSPVSSESECPNRLIPVPIPHEETNILNQRPGVPPRKTSTTDDDAIQPLYIVSPPLVPSKFRRGFVKRLKKFGTTVRTYIKAKNGSNNTQNNKTQANEGDVSFPNKQISGGTETNESKDLVSQRQSPPTLVATQKCGDCVHGNLNIERHTHSDNPTSIPDNQCNIESKAARRFSFPLLRQVHYPKSSTPTLTAVPQTIAPPARPNVVDGPSRSTSQNVNLLSDENHTDQARDFQNVGSTYNTADLPLFVMQKQRRLSLSSLLNISKSKTGPATNATTSSWCVYP